MSEAHHELGFWQKYVFSTDHKVIGIQYGITALVFLFFPTTVGRPPINIIDQSNWCYRLLVQIDRPINACPSLHASLCVFAAMLCHTMLADAPQRWLWRGFLWLWTLAILYSTVSTRQHVFIDIAAGAALALIAYSLISYVKPLAQLTALPAPAAPHESSQT